ncbi:YdeI/OmpD-associated family protein [Gordonia polyisoprenivorans]|uniref:YdeI/OmpD-associated family protein n=1 Tax=Gordonia polyisoprenivorans TaxID=84595 RepID=UPI001AD6C194|nr:YdeI/OmpD-associated family protein [Gordonia polyisoprenivorans]QTI69887.1 YdeI/OmpD-associated family protein [Gordonia polyisoprenivorans]
MADPDAPELLVEHIDAWREWLAGHHASASGVWLVFWRKESGHEPLDYDDAVREALCWGWIDGVTRTIDAHRRGMWFTRRGRGSAWAASNKQRVAELIDSGRMQPPGLAVIDDAKARGLWNLLDDAEAGVEHPDLTVALDANPTARAHWDAFPPGARKAALTQIAMARKPETKARRITVIVEKAARDERP